MQPRVPTWACRVRADTSTLFGDRGGSSQGRESTCCIGLGPAGLLWKLMRRRVAHVDSGSQEGELLCPASGTVKCRREREGSAVTGRVCSHLPHHPPRLHLSQGEAPSPWTLASPQRTCIHSSPSQPPPLLRKITSFPLFVGGVYDFCHRLLVLNCISLLLCTKPFFPVG